MTPGTTIRNSVLIAILEQQPSLIDKVTLCTIAKNKYLDRDKVYFPDTAVIAAVGGKKMTDLAQLRSDESTWTIPHDFQVRLTGAMYVLPRLAIAGLHFSTLRQKNTDRVHALISIWLQSILNRSLKECVAAYLLQFNMDNLPLTQQDIGEALGSRRESVSEILADFEHNKWLTKARGMITLLNNEALKDLAVGDW